MIKKSLKVEGMTCQHCVQTITNSLEDKQGIETVAINIDKKEVRIEFDEANINLEQISSEIVALGFEIKK